MRHFGWVFALEGRAGRREMMAATLMLLAAGAAARWAQASGAAGLPITLLQLAIAWPALVALPVRRLHDMGRAGWWTAALWLAASVGFAFVALDLATRAPLVGMNLWEALRSTEAFRAAMEARLAGTSEAGKVLSAIGMGGLSLAMIFLFIQFGWLHLVPGEARQNRYGPPRRPPHEPNR